jgi:hypothetical protein
MSPRSAASIITCGEGGDSGEALDVAVGATTLRVVVAAAPVAEMGVGIEAAEDEGDAPARGLAQALKRIARTVAFMTVR